MKIMFYDDAWDDYVHFSQTDRKKLEKINQLIKAIERDPHHGPGNPEPLRGDLSGYWSRRIDMTNRLVYVCDDEANIIHILMCRGHYSR